MYQFLSLFVIALISRYVLCSSQPGIIVIGAGPSGVAAATKLLANGFTNLTVLEAEARYGGRIYSVYFGDAYVDLGAHWCHGEVDNTVYSLVKDLNLLRHTEGEATIYHSRERISPDFNDRLSGILGAVFSGNTSGSNESVRDYYIRRFTEVSFANLTDPLELKIANETSRLLLQFILAHRGSITLDDVILNRDYKICPGDLRLNWNGGGYKTILDVLIRNIPDPSQRLPFEEKLQLNKEVRNVNWESSAVKVTCSDGSSFVADHVIFTPSVGVLKHYHEELFTPNLPEEKKTAIQDIGLGAIVDYSFYFPIRWWPSDNVFSGYYFVWDEKDFDQAVQEYANFTQNVNNRPRCYAHLICFLQNSTSPEWILDLFNVEPTQKNPNVLTFWVTGSTAPYVEQISDEELINGTLFVLNKFLGRYHNITQPSQLIR